MHVIRSEIPQLEVITAIPDADSEDFLSQLLYSQGWSIIHRAFDGNSLRTFLEQRGTNLRTVIVYQSDLSNFSSNIPQVFASPTVTFICLDGVTFSSHEIMTVIRGQLRAPMLQVIPDQIWEDKGSEVIESIATKVSSKEAISPSRFSSESQATSARVDMKRAHREDRKKISIRKVIAITGSTGAPGRTRFSKTLAEELAKGESVLLVDADIKSQGQVVKKVSSSNNRIESIALEREMRPTQLPSGSEVTLVDLGTMPGLAETTTDRRWHGSLVNSVLGDATTLVYLCKSTSSSIGELAQFLREYPLLLSRIPVTYICVLAGHSRDLREWEGKFLTLTTGENRFVIREAELDQSSGTSIAGSLRLRSSKRSAIAKIALSLT